MQIDIHDVDRQYVGLAGVKTALVNVDVRDGGRVNLQPLTGQCGERCDRVCDWRAVGIGFSWCVRGSALIDGDLGKV